MNIDFGKIIDFIDSGAADDLFDKELLEVFGKKPSFQSVMVAHLKVLSAILKVGLIPPDPIPSGEFICESCAREDSIPVTGMRKGAFCEKCGEWKSCASKIEE